MLNRLDIIVQAKPAKIFILTGTNDITQGFHQKDFDRCYEEIITRIAEASPDTKLYIQSLLPRATSLDTSVQEINKVIRQIAKSYSLHYIDINPHFHCPDASICDELSPDEIHLNKLGYVCQVV